MLIQRVVVRVLMAVNAVLGRFARWLRAR